MNEVEFKIWLSNNRTAPKIQSDLVSRLKRVEREIKDCDIDEQYRSDKCEYLMSLFSNMGKNPEMEKYPDSDFPVGKYTMNTFRHAIKCYVKFCDEKSG